MEGRVEAYDLGRTPGRVPSLEEELAALEADTGVNDELEALKARLNNSIPNGSTSGPNAEKQ
jgi:phage shock protein A